MQISPRRTGSRRCSLPQPLAETAAHRVRTGRDLRARGRGLPGIRVYESDPPRARLRTVADARIGENTRVPAYMVNRDAVRHAKRLIDARQYVLRSRWQEVQPHAREQNAFLKAHSWEEYAWHLGLTEGAAEETKARYAFVYGDFRRLHRG
jgi:hypothetical protein